MIDPVYVGVLVLLNFGYTIFLVYVDRTTTVWQYEKFKILAILSSLVNFIFIIDVVLNFVILRPKNIWKEKKFIYFELFLQVASLTWLIISATDDHSYTMNVFYSDITLMFMLRNARALAFFSEVTSFKLIVETM